MNPYTGSTVIVRDGYVIMQNSVLVWNVVFNKKVPDTNIFTYFFEYRGFIVEC